MFDSISFMEMFKQLCDVDKWLESLGITHRERFSRVMDMVEKLVIEYSKAMAGQDFKTDENREMQNGMFEAQPFLSIYHNFKDCTDTEFLRLFKVAVRGPEFSTDENPNDNEPRNHLFALILAAKIKERGLIVKHFNDIVLDFEGHDIAIQCKRPFSLERLAQSIDGAYGQFHTENRMDSNNNVRGIIAISVEKILELDKSTFKFNTRDDIEKYLNKTTQELYDAHRIKWEHLKNKNVFGIFFYYRFLAEINDENNKAYVIDTPVINLLISKEHSDAQLLTNLANLLK